MYFVCTKPRVLSPEPINQSINSRLTGPSQKPDMVKSGQKLSWGYKPRGYLGEGVFQAMGRSYAKILRTGGFRAQQGCQWPEESGH